MISLLKSWVDLLEPPGLIWVALAVGIVHHFRRRNRLQLTITAAAWLMLTLTAALPVPHLLLASLEREWPPVVPAAFPECDAIMVLGGGLEPSDLEPAGIHLHVGADRLFTALTLAEAGKGKLLVVGGGIFKNADGRSVSEADGVREWLKQRSMTPLPVQSLGGCMDTHDEAVKVAALAKKNGWSRVALVTSAFHMRRASAVFKKAGVPVVPAPCNYLSTPMRGRPLHWFNLPNATHLQLFEVWMHEIVGWWGYKLHGWI